jgi:hypothetical protein
VIFSTAVYIRCLFTVLFFLQAIQAAEFSLHEDEKEPKVILDIVHKDKDDNHLKNQQKFVIVIKIHDEKLSRVILITITFISPETNILFDFQKIKKNNCHQIYAE